MIRHMSSATIERSEDCRRQRSVLLADREVLGSEKTARVLPQIQDGVVEAFLGI